jgi:hypothetical protein
MAMDAGVGGMRVRAGTPGMQKRKKTLTSLEMQMEVCLCSLLVLRLTPWKIR